MQYMYNKYNVYVPSLLQFRPVLSLGGLKSKSIGFTVTFHESHKSVPLFRRCHHIRRFDGERLSIGKFGIHIVRGYFTVSSNATTEILVLIIIAVAATSQTMAYGRDCVRLRIYLHNTISIARYTIDNRPISSSKTAMPLP